MLPIPTTNNTSSEMELINIILNSSIDKERSSCWEECFSSQFPTGSMIEKNGKYIVQVGAPHEGYTIETHLLNNKIHGKSNLYSNEDLLIAELTFEEGVAEGPCTLYDTSNLLFFSGYFKNGYRSGKGKEYDREGNVIFDGYFSLGKRLYLSQLNEMEGYWKEYDEKGRLLNISARNAESGEKEGICYYYDENDEISQIVEVKEGVENEYNGYCKFYDEPHKIWFEGFVENGVRHGEGKEYDANGESVIYQGSWIEGERQDTYTFDQVMTFYKELFNNEKKRVHCSIVCERITAFFALIVIIIAVCFLISEGLGITITVLILQAILLCIKWSFCDIQYGIDFFMAKMLSRTDLIFKKKCCKSTREFSPPSCVEYIEFGDECFESVKTFDIDGLSQLYHLKIPKNSFTPLKQDDWKNLKLSEAAKKCKKSKSFYIMNCESLESIEIGEYSFSVFAGDFILNNLPQLQSIQIGKYGSYSCNFLYSSFEIRGIEVILNS